MKKYLLALLLGVMVLSTGVNVSLAEDPCSFEAYGGRGDGAFLLPDCLKPDNAPGFSREIMTATDGSNIKILISYVAGGIAALSGIIAVIFIMYHGFMLTVLGGDEGARGESLKRIQWAVIGLIGVIFAYVVVNVVLDIVLEVGRPPETTTTTSTGATTEQTAPSAEVPIEVRNQQQGYESTADDVRGMTETRSISDPGLENIQ